MNILMLVLYKDEPVVEEDGSVVDAGVDEEERVVDGDGSVVSTDVAEDERVVGENGSVVDAGVDEEERVVNEENVFDDDTEPTSFGNGIAAADDVVDRVDCDGMVVFNEGEYSFDDKNSIWLSLSKINDACSDEVPFFLQSSYNFG